MVISDIIAEAGSYYIDGGQGVKDIIKRFRQRMQLDSLCSDATTTTDTIARKANTLTTSVLQAYQNAWTPKGVTTFEMESIELFKMKVDVEEHPDDLEDSWLGFLAGIDELDRAKWPFVRWWLENEILPTMEEDYEVYTAFFGKYVAPTGGTASSAASSGDGDRVIINRLIAANKISPIVMGAVPTTDGELLVKYLEEMAKKMPKVLWGKMEPIRLSQDLAQLFIDGQDSLYNKAYVRVEDKLKLHNLPFKIAAFANEEGEIIPGCRSMNGSTKIWTTVKGNSVLRTKNPKNQGVFKVEGVKRQVSAYTDFWKGRGFWLGEYVFTNNVDMVAV